MPQERRTTVILAVAQVGTPHKEGQVPPGQLEQDLPERAGVMVGAMPLWFGASNNFSAAFLVVGNYLVSGIFQERKTELECWGRGAIAELRQMSRQSR